VKALKDNCVMTNFDVDLFQENSGTLQNLFGNNRIIALFDIPDGCASRFTAPFTVFSKSLLYSKFFTAVPVKGTESYSIYITNSLLNKGNVIKLMNDFYEYDGSVYIKTVQPDLLRPHMEGIFGFRKIQLGSHSVPIELCYPKIISAHDAHYHLSPEKDDPSAMQIIPELPERYPVEKYVDNLEEIRARILPSSLTVNMKLSATVTKAVT
jgi:hypothetical protein